MANASNIKAWSDRAKSNSYGNNKAQARDILNGVGIAQDAKGDWSDTDWKQPQRKQEGQGWAKMDSVTASHTYTGSKGGTKRG